MNKPSYKLVTLISLIFASHLAFANLPKTQTSVTGLRYMTGGIGEDQVEEMQPYAKKFTLNLVFSEGVVGRLATNINVNIYDEASNLTFRIVGSEPVLYVNLPAGTYTILANNNGNKLRQKITLEGSTNKKVVLNWKDFVEEDVPLDAEGN
jgi:hypothetical protein